MLYFYMFHVHFIGEISNLELFIFETAVQWKFGANLLLFSMYLLTLLCQTWLFVLVNNSLKYLFFFYLLNNCWLFSARQLYSIPMYLINVCIIVCEPEQIFNACFSLHNISEVILSLFSWKENNYSELHVWSRESTYIWHIFDLMIIYIVLFVIMDYVPCGIK